MATASGIYQHLPPSVKKSIRKINQLIGKGGGNSSGNPQRNHHYTFDVDDNGLDINGFILHTDKHKGKRHKFRVYLDSNKNGRFDKNDPLIGRTGLKHKHAAKGVGNLLDEDEIGQVEVKFKRSPLMQSYESYGDSIDTHLAGLSSNLSASSGYQIEGQGAINKLGSSDSDVGNEPTYSVNSMSFSDSGDFNKAWLGVHTLGAKAAWGQLH